MHRVLNVSFQILRYNDSIFMHDLHHITEWSKRDPVPLSKFLGRDKHPQSHMQIYKQSLSCKHSNTDMMTMPPTNSSESTPLNSAWWDIGQKAYE